MVTVESQDSQSALCPYTRIVTAIVARVASERQLCRRAVGGIALLLRHLNKAFAAPPGATAIVAY